MLNRPGWRQHAAGSLGHVARQSTLAGAAQLTGLVLRFGTAVLIARLLGPAALGLYVLALALANGAVVVATVGLDRAVPHFIAHHRGQQEPAAAVGVFIFSSLLAASMSLVVGALMFVSGPRVAAWLHNSDLAAAAPVVALAVPFLVLGQIARAGLTGFEDVRSATALEQLAMPAATAGVFLTIHLLRPSDISAPVMAAAVAQASAGVVSWLALRARIAHEGPAVSLRPREWLKFGLPLWLERGMLFLVASSGYGFLARFRDPGTVGAFGAAVRVAALVGMPMVAVSAIFGPTISNLSARGEWEALQALYARLTWTLAGIGGALGLAVAVSSKWVLAGFGPHFSTAWGALAILAASQVVNSATGPSGLVLIMTGRTGLRLANASVGAGMTVALSWLAVPRWGALGAAAAVASSSSLLNVVQVRQVRRLVGLWAYDRRRVGPSLDSPMMPPVAGTYDERRST